MDKKRIILWVIVLLTIGIVAILITLHSIKSNRIFDSELFNKVPLYKSEYTNYAWGKEERGYIIYENGVIEQYDNSDTPQIESPKKAKLKNNELKKILELANEVSDDFEVDNSLIQATDVGVKIEQIYNQKLEKWIILKNNNGANNSDVAKEILEFTKELENKYLK